jgi:hypothetical protein
MHGYAQTLSKDCQVRTQLPNDFANRPVVLKHQRILAL